MLLKFLRKRKNMKRIMWALAIMIIPAFVIWGAGTSEKRKEKGPSYAGKVFSRKVSFEEYLDMWQVSRDYAVRTFGTNTPPAVIDQLAWNRILLLEAARRENISVKNDELIEKIVSFPAFWRNGVFDKELYKSALGESARSFEEKLKDDILVSKLREKITSNAFVSDEEAKKSYRDKFRKVKLSYVAIPFSDFEKLIQYEDSGLATFYELNKAHFKKPEQVNVEYLKIPFSEFKHKGGIKEEDIKRYFEEHLSDFKKPDSPEESVLDDDIKNEIIEKLAFQEARYRAEERSYSILDEVIREKNLETPAKTFLLKIEETGFFSETQEIPAIGWSYEFANASFSLNPNDIYPAPIKTNTGFYIIRLKEKRKPYIPGIEEIKDAVKESYIKDRAIKLSEGKSLNILSDIRNEEKNGISFEDAVQKYDLRVKETPLITGGDYIQELGPASEIVKTALSLEVGGFAGPVRAPASWVILRLDEVQEIDEAEFAEKKDKFKEALLSEKKQEIFDAWFEGFREKSQFTSFTNIK